MLFATSLDSLKTSRKERLVKKKKNPFVSNIRFSLKSQTVQKVEFNCLQCPSDSLMTSKLQVLNRLNNGIIGFKYTFLFSDQLRRKRKDF